MIIVSEYLFGGTHEVFQTHLTDNSSEEQLLLEIETHKFHLTRSIRKIFHWF